MRPSAAAPATSSTAAAPAVSSWWGGLGRVVSGASGALLAAQWGSAAVGRVVETVRRRAEANAALQERVLLQQQGSGFGGTEGVRQRQQQQQAAGEHLVTMWQGAAGEGTAGHSRDRGAAGPRHSTANNSVKANGSYYYGGNYY